MRGLPNAETGDPWGITPAKGSSRPYGPADTLSVTTLRGIQPLGDQIGQFPKRTVPAQLTKALFGQPAPAPDEIEDAGGDPAKVPPMHSFAVLDAARIVNLVPMLQDSGLEHRCLFTGAALTEAGDAAPWIVRLEPDNRFTRNLFTEGPAPWQIWADGDGMILRARAGLDQIWRHFRRFTRVRDELGNWFYFRFWEPRYAESYFASLAEHPDKLHAWFMTDSGKLDSICIGRGENFTIFAYAGPAMPRGRPKRPFRYEAPERSAHVHAKRTDFIRRLCQHLRGASARFNALPPARQTELAWHFTTDATTSGITIESAVANFAEASVILWRPLKTDAEFSHILTAKMHQIDKGKQLLHAARQPRTK